MTQDLSQQLQVLIDNAPRHGVPAAVMEQAIAPVIAGFAKSLRHHHYYVIQHPQQGWVLTTIKYKQNPQQLKKVIYAYGTLTDAENCQPQTDEAIAPKPIPVSDLIFQLSALKPVHSIIFFDTPGSLQGGFELERERLQTALTEQLHQLPPEARTSPSSPLPPNLA